MTEIVIYTSNNNKKTLNELTTYEHHFLFIKFLPHIVSNIHQCIKLPHVLIQEDAAKAN